MRTRSIIAGMALLVAAPAAFGAVGSDLGTTAYTRGLLRSNDAPSFRAGLGLVSTNLTSVTNYNGNGNAITNLNASELRTGTVPIARLAGITTNQMDGVTDTAYRNPVNIITQNFAGTLTASAFAGNGAGLTGIGGISTSTNQAPVVVVFPSGIAIGPNGSIDTTNTTTADIQEAIDYLCTNPRDTNQAPGGGTIQLQSGFYHVTSSISISNTYMNPVKFLGSGWMPSTIINYRGATQQPLWTGANTSSYPANVEYHGIIFSYQPLFKQPIFKIKQVGSMYFNRCTFSSYSFLTNGGIEGTIFNTYATPAGAYIVGLELGDLYFTNFYAYGGALFDECNWRDLAAGGISTMDHIQFRKCSFALIGGNNKEAPLTNAWTASGYYQTNVPDAFYSLHPAWVDYSLYGDVKMDDCDNYYTYCLLLKAHQNSIGHPTIRNTSAASMEGGAWYLLQYDDIGWSGNAYGTGTFDSTKAQVEMWIEPDTRVQGLMSLVKATNSIVAGKYPAALKLVNGPSKILGPTNQFSVAYDFYNDATKRVIIRSGDAAGKTIINGQTFLDNLAAGVTVDIASCTVSGGTDSGINGTYYLSDRIYAEPNGNLNVYCWTNSTYVVVPYASSAGLGGNGAIHLLTDTNLTNELYGGSDDGNWATGLRVPAAGTYQVSNGAGTPPTVTFTQTTNTTRFAGAVESRGAYYGNGTGITNIPAAAISNGTVVLAASANALTGSNYFSKALTFATNGNPVVPDFSIPVNYFSTNAAFTFLAPIGVDTTKKTYQRTYVYVTNTTAAAKAVTAPAATRAAGTMFVTNLTKFEFETYAQQWTNCIATPIF